MSRYIQILNALKQNITHLSLTPNQADCRTKILERLEYPGILNLSGPNGSGKTVLGWHLANEGHVVYVEEPARICTMQNGPAILFVDNAGHSRDEYRCILDTLDRAHIACAVIVSQERIEDYVLSLVLACDQDDINIAVDNLSRLGFSLTVRSDETTFLDLWDVLQFNARRDSCSTMDSVIS
jgi:hypothetical protein